MTHRAFSGRLPSLAAAMLVLACCCRLPTSAAADDLGLQFYMNRVELWNQNSQQMAFQLVIVNGLKAYCADSANAVACGFGASPGTTVNFTTSDVQIADGYPKNAGFWYMDLRFGIKYAVGGAPYTMPTAAVAAITLSRRQAIKDATGHYIVYIGKSFYTVPPPTVVNQVVISIAVLVTAALIGAAFALRHRHRDEETERLLQARRETNGSRNRVGAVTSEDQPTPQQPQPQPLPKSMNGGIHPHSDKIVDRDPHRLNGVPLADGGAPSAARSRLEKAGRHNYGFEKSFNGQEIPAVSHEESKIATKRFSQNSEPRQEASLEPQLQPKQQQPTGELDAQRRLERRDSSRRRHTESQEERDGELHTLEEDEEERRERKQKKKRKKSRRHHHHHQRRSSEEDEREAGGRRPDRTPLEAMTVAGAEEEAVVRHQHLAVEI